MSKNKIVLVAQLLISIVAVVLVFTSLWKISVAWAIIQGTLFALRK